MSCLRRTHVLTLVAVLALTATVAVPAAFGGTERSFSTHLTLSHKAPAFHGKVFSPGGSLCTDHRRVSMYRQRSGPDKLLGRTISHHGRWYVRHPNFPSGTYYAKVKKGGSAALGITCMGARSNVVVVD